jgi:thiamine-phosphate pyrophosphorylase
MMLEQETPLEFDERLGQDDPRPQTALYLISPPHWTPDFLEALKQALDGGPVACLQLRLKTASDAEVLQAGEALKPLLEAYDVALILNDRADLAKALDAEGVHLGQSDGSVAQARAMLGHARTIGVTCHNSRHLAMEAGDQGADYVAFGAFYPSSTKTPPAYADPALLTWWVGLSELPCVAIGGITPGNAAPLVRAGADFLAVSQGVWHHPQGPLAAVRAFHSVIEQEKHPHA